MPTSRLELRAADAGKDAIRYGRQVQAALDKDSFDRDARRSLCNWADFLSPPFSIGGLE